MKTSDKIKHKISSRINKLMSWCATKTYHKYRIFRDIATLCTPKAELEYINRTMLRALERNN